MVNVIGQQQNWAGVNNSLTCGSLEVCNTMLKRTMSQSHSEESFNSNIK